MKLAGKSEKNMESQEPDLDCGMEAREDGRGKNRIGDVVAFGATSHLCYRREVEGR